MSAALTFERTRDYELVRRIITHPKVYRWMVSDGAVPADEYQTVEDEAIIYLLCKEGKELQGLFMVIPLTSVCVQVHVCLLPWARNAKAVECYREGLHWLWLNTKFVKVIGFTPAYNFAALRCAEKAGLERVGVITRSLQKFGKLQDQVVYAIGKPEEGVNHHG
jgi:hypothetical protein